MTGVDCIGLIMCVAIDLDLAEVTDEQFKRMSRYGPRGDIPRLIAGLNRYLTPVDTLDIGDVAHIAWGPGQEYHVAIISRLRPLSVIHAAGDRGCVTECIVHRRMSIVQGYRFKGVK